MVLRFRSVRPSGGLAQFRASFGATETETLRAFGSKGDVERGPGCAVDCPKRLWRDGVVEETPFPQIAHFCDSIPHGAPPQAVHPADMRTPLAIEQAAITGLPRLIGDRSPTCSVTGMLFFQPKEPKDDHPCVDLHLRVAPARFQGSGLVGQCRPR